MRSLKHSFSLKESTPRRQSLKALMYREVLLLGCGDATRRRASLLDEKARPTQHSVTKGSPISSKYSAMKRVSHDQKAINQVPAYNWSMYTLQQKVTGYMEATLEPDV